MRTIGNILLAIILIFVAAQFADAQENDQEQSLADYARAMSAKKKPEVLVNEEDAKKLFKDVEDILKFASDDSGFPRRTAVKHKLISREEADKYFATALAESDQAKKVQQSELVLKKFGMLPADFHMSSFLSDNTAKGLGGFYDFHDKTMYLLNWIPMEKQRVVMAHELTHALQDQNYNLMAFHKAADKSSDTEGEARSCVIEGQAMMVFLDYLIKPLGRSLATSGDDLDSLKSLLMSSYDSPVNVHNAPLVYKEITMFPYIDGFAFELEIMKRAGAKAAFAGTFVRPPRNTHEIMQPDAYLAAARSSFKLPDLATAAGNGYKPYDAGTIGELDARIMAKTFGRENDAYLVAPAWDGGGYVALKKPASAAKADAELTTSDLALVYVSHWKAYSAAKRLAELYKAGLLKRTQLTDADLPQVAECAKDCAAKWSAHFNTDDGPVVIEISSDNTLLISQGLDDKTMTQVKQALVKKPAPGARAAAAAGLKIEKSEELSLRLAGSPLVQAMRANLMETLVAQIVH